jgi:hypothetical protein
MERLLATRLPIVVDPWLSAPYNSRIGFISTMTLELQLPYKGSV